MPEPDLRSDQPFFEHREDPDSSEILYLFGALRPHNDPSWLRLYPIAGDGAEYLLIHVSDVRGFMRLSVEEARYRGFTGDCFRIELQQSAAIRFMAEPSGDVVGFEVPARTPSSKSNGAERRPHDESAPTRGGQKEESVALSWLEGFGEGLGIGVRALGNAFTFGAFEEQLAPESAADRRLFRIASVPAVISREALIAAGTIGLGTALHGARAAQVARSPVLRYLGAEQLLQSSPRAIEIASRTLTGLRLFEGTRGGLAVGQGLNRVAQGDLGGLFQIGLGALGLAGAWRTVFTPGMWPRWHWRSGYFPSSMSTLGSANYFGTAGRGLELSHWASFSRWEEGAGGLVARALRALRVINLRAMPRIAHRIGDPFAHPVGGLAALRQDWFFRLMHDAFGRTGITRFIWRTPDWALVGGTTIGGVAVGVADHSAPAKARRRDPLANLLQ